MKEFTYQVSSEQGIHARPAGIIVKLAKDFPSTEITISKGDKTAKASQLIALMGMMIQKGDNITIHVRGDHEEEASAALEKFCLEHL